MLTIRNKKAQNAVAAIQEVQTADSEENAREEKKTEAEKILETMTLEEKAAQIFFVTPEDITGVNTATVAGDATRQALETYPVGGIVYFSKNILEPEQIRSMLENTWNYSQEVMKIPVWLGVDEEGGQVARVAENPMFQVSRYESMRSIGDTKDPDQAYQAGETIAAYLKDLGFNMDLRRMRMLSQSSEYGDRRSVFWNGSRPGRGDDCRCGGRLPGSGDICLYKAFSRTWTDRRRYS